MHWKIAAQLPVAKGQIKALGFAGPVAGIHKNRLIVAGGANFSDSMPWQGGRKKYYDDVYVFRKKGKKIIPHNQLFKIPFNIAYAASCYIPGGIIFAGGENEKGISNKAILLQWNEKSEGIITKELPDLPIAVTNAAATVNRNIVYVAGGEAETLVSDKFYSLDVNNIADGWKELPPLPKPVSHMLLTIQSNDKNDCIYLIGGRKKNSNGVSDIYESVYEFDLVRNIWAEKRPLPYSLSAGTGVAAGPHYIVLFGGDKGETFHKIETLIAAINVEKNDLKRQNLIIEKNRVQSSHPGFSKDVLLYDTKSDMWNRIDSIPFDSPVTTMAIKWQNDIIFPSGEIRAGIRSPLLLSCKIYSLGK